jgi:hypothetical protein
MLQLSIAASPAHRMTSCYIQAQLLAVWGWYDTCHQHKEQSRWPYSIDGRYSGTPNDLVLYTTSAARGVGLVWHVPSA